jgi:hypothetical protein
MVKGYIYRHWIINDKGIEKSYIGQTINELEVRWQKGLGYTTIDSKFSKAIKKYGWNNFHHDNVETVECGTKEELKDVLNSLEKTYIETYDSFYNGYNSTTGGEGYIVSDETKNKISEGNKRAVVCLNTGEIFESMLAAVEWVDGRTDGTGTGHISLCCTNDLKRAYNHPLTGENLCWVYYRDYVNMSEEEINQKLLIATKDAHYNSDNIDNYTITYNQDFSYLTDIKDVLKPIYSILSPCQTYVFNEHILNGDTLETVAKRHNVTTTRIGNVSKQIVKKITERYTYEEFINLIK